MFEPTITKYIKVTRLESLNRVPWETDMQRDAYSISSSPRGCMTTVPLRLLHQFFLQNMI